MLKGTTKKCVLAIVFFMISIFYVCQTRALANNHTDTSYTFTFRTEMNGTSPREKTDTSSTYMKCTSIPSNRSYTAYVCGSNTISGNSVTDVSRGYNYLFQKDTVYFMRNWVHENGYKYATVMANRNYGTSFVASGVWSPDSIDYFTAKAPELNEVQLQQISFAI